MIFCGMAAPITIDPAGEALLTAVRAQSPQEERRCHALFGLTDACSALSKALRRRLAESDLTEIGFRILAIVIRNEPRATPQNELASLLGVQPRSLSVVLGRLEISGLLRKERPQRRSKQWPVKATPEGQLIFSLALKHCHRQIHEASSALDASSLHVLEDACERLQHLCTKNAENAHNSI